MDQLHMANGQGLVRSGLSGVSKSLYLPLAGPLALSTLCGCETEESGVLYVHIACI